jgi:rhamnosyltransferase
MPQTPVAWSTSRRSTRAELRAAVVVRAHNDAGTIARVLAALRRQSLPPADVVVLDASSTDATADIARREGARVRTVDPDRVSDGAVLNLSLRLSGAPVVAFLSAHAVPASRNWLAAILAPFHDPQVGAAFGRQIPHSNCNPLEALELRQRYGPNPKRYTEDPPLTRVNVAVRRQRVMDRPFDENLSGAETRVWARDLCQRGFTVAYVPRAQVHHSHHESFRGTLRRERCRAKAFARHLQQDSLLADWWALPFAFGFSLVRDWGRLLIARHHPRWMLRAPAYRLAVALGTWLGHRDADRATR